MIAPCGKLGFAMPAAAWAARSGDPILYAGRDKLPAATAKALRRHPKVPAYVLGPSSAISSDVLREIGKISPSVHRVAGEDPVENAIALARYSDGGFGWNVNDPGHGFVVARSDEPLDAAAASPLSAAGHLGPAAPHRRRRYASGGPARVPARRQAGLHGRPDARLLQPRVGDRRPGGDRGGTTGRNRRPRRAGEDRRKVMSEAENPELLGRAARGQPEDIRALAGASTPHFALQVRNRIQRLIEPLPPATRLGSKASARSPSSRASPSTAATRAGRWGSAAIEVPGTRASGGSKDFRAADQHLSRRGRPDRRRAELGPAPHLRRLTAARSPCSPSPTSTPTTRASPRTSARHAGSRSPVMRTTSTRWRAGGRSEAPPPSGQPVFTGFGRAHRTRSAGCSSEGDEVAGFRVVHAPGHARGEVIFFRDSDRVAICGDVIRNMSYATALPAQGAAGDLHLRPGREPPLDPQARRPRAEPDPARARPRGHRHGRLQRFVASLA